jgi:signal transduction histidine kinase/DNA-binding response OmpR family regulator
VEIGRGEAAMSELKALIAPPTRTAPDSSSGSKRSTDAHLSRLESENAAIAARSFRIIGLIVFLFQFLYLTADRATMGRYPDEFLPYYFVNFADALFAIAVAYTRWFAYSWKPLALVQVGTLAATGMIMNIMSGALMPQFYIIITFSFGCATFLPWGVFWQSALNLVCLASYIIVVVKTGVSEPFVWYQWISLFAVLLLSEFPAAFIDRYRGRVFCQVEELTAALKASRDKSEFLASMSHEMRTPLNAIIGMTEVLESTELTREQSQYLEICRANGDTLIGLIDDIVDISRIEAGELRVDRAEFDLNDLMNRICDAVALRAHRKGLELIFDITPGTPAKLIGDPMRLQQVCLNLLVNAIKFTEQGEIVMRVCRDSNSDQPGMLLFRVIDTGIGISTEEMKRMFSRFARAESSLSLGLEGSGLGLEISKRLVEAMGGRICVESELGRGSTFQFTCRVELQRGEEELIESSLLKGIRVLVADENETYRSVIGEMLCGAGASVRLCDGTPSVFRVLNDSRHNGAGPHAILLDTEMPPGDGIGSAREFDGTERAKTIIMLARDDFPRGPRAVRDAGFGGFLLKPIKKTELLEAVDRIAAKHRVKGIMDISRHETSLNGESNRRRILLAEDSLDNRLLISAYVRNTPYQVETAENGKDAVEMFKQSHYDLVLMDLNMPVLGGYAAVGAIRAWEQDQGAHPTPILALTGRAMAEDRRKSMDAGCNGHLTKPIRREVLMEAISRFTFIAPGNES